MFRSSGIKARVFIDDEPQGGVDVVVATGKVPGADSATKLQDGRVEVGTMGCSVEQLRDALRQAAFKISVNQERGIPFATIDEIRSV